MTARWPSGETSAGLAPKLRHARSKSRRRAGIAAIWPNVSISDEPVWQQAKAKPSHGERTSPGARISSCTRPRPGPWYREVWTRMEPGLLAFLSLPFWREREKTDAFVGFQGSMHVSETANSLPAG